MAKLNGYTDIDKAKQGQILKLVTNSFYKELVNYGVNSSDLITVSVNLLDFVTNHKSQSAPANGYYNRIFRISQVQNDWKQNKVLTFNDVSIKPLTKDLLPQLSHWLDTSDIENTFISLFPKEVTLLDKYFLDRSDRQFFSIFYKTDNFVGIIGAENIDYSFKKAEMKKFIGAGEFRGKGLGKLSTFLFLYYVFKELNLNKIYIHSLDTNIQNINLNSKFGFELEGILYKEAFMNGNFRDVLRMGLLRSTWLSIFEEADTASSTKTK